MRRLCANRWGYQEYKTQLVSSRSPQEGELEDIDLYNPMQSHLECDRQMGVKAFALRQRGILGTKERQDHRSQPAGEGKTGILGRGPTCLTARET